jgi:hypothetical protein
LNPEGAVDLIDKAEGLFDDAEGEKFVFQELRNAKPLDISTVCLGTLICARRENDVTAPVCSDDNFAILDSILSA